MGLFRKITSVSTLGAVDLRSDKERIARYTKQMRDDGRRASRPGQGFANGMQDVLDRSKAIKAAEVAQRKELAARDAQAPPAAAGPPPGFYNDSADPTLQRWWDGTAWSEHTQSKP